MTCGHVSNATDELNNPVCVICYGVENEIVCECINNNGLIGRKAKCIYGDKITDSRWDLPFFKYCPEEEFDEYYCGCYGWD